MRTTARIGLTGVLAVVAAVGCKSSAVEQPDEENTAGAGNAEPVLSLAVGPQGRTFVELSTPALAEVEGTGKSSIAWDLALQGRDVFTNGGISGPGSSNAFGPLSPPTYLSDMAPDVPLLLEDRAGGALLDWYDYGGESHQLFSRYHVYGVRDGERLFKVQILGYYGEQLGAPVAGLYRVRYAEVTEDQVGATHEVTGIDATAGGSKDDDAAPSGCLDFDSERVSALTPAQAKESDAWQLCFRREAIAVNGGFSGPRGVTAVDLQADESADETQDEIERRTAASEKARFDAQDFSTLGDPALDYRPDGVVTAFGQRWLQPGTEPLELRSAVWLVLGADGASKYLVRFSNLSGDPGIEPATLDLEAKLVR